MAADNLIWKHYVGDVVESCNSTRLGHAVVAVDFDATSFRLRNQWGSAWGEKGYIRLKQDGTNSACGVVNYFGAYPVLK